jgi:hypothetical protein
MDGPMNVKKKLYMFFIFDKYLLSAAIQPECYDTSVVIS